MIGERYVLFGLHASGAQSKVYKGQDKITGGSRIIKTGSEIRKEALLARSLRHPLIAYPYDFGVDHEHGEYAVYPEFPGTTSLQWVKKNGEKEQLKSFIAQVSEFLCYLHHQGWLYNDFKPEHFLIHHDRLKVIDLGLCSEMKGGSHSNTFSGTFPYISPERLNGRPFDQRSDIFAFGILLLQLLLSEDEVPVEPSQGALQTFLYKANLLEEPWKNLILQMTALEPSQRISSALELLKKIHPPGEMTQIPARADSLSIPPEILNSKLLCLHSCSDRTLDEAYNAILLQSWESGDALYSFPFQQISPDESFQKLCLALTGKRMSDPYAGFRAFDHRKSEENICVLFRAPEVLTPEQRALFFFGISCLAEYERIRIVLLSKKTWDTSLSEPWVQFGLAAMDESESQTSIESLSPSARKMLIALALSGGKLSQPALEMFGNERTLKELQQLGLLYRKEDVVALAISCDSVLSRLRSSQRQSSAQRVLQKIGDVLDPVTTFHLATHAGEQKLAARSALMTAKLISPQCTTRLDWYWKAFISGSPIPRKILFPLVRHNLRAGDFKKVGRLLKYIRNRFGDSFRLADFWLDYFHRQHKLDKAIEVSARYARMASLQRKEKLEQYFLARHAGFLVLNHDYVPAADVLDKLSTSAGRQVSGLLHHFRGLLNFYHGNVSDSLKEFRKASKIKHRFRSSSIMNIGVAFGKMGQFERAEKWLNRSISMFSKIEDKDRLTHAYLNLGMLYQNSGRTDSARKNYFRSLQISRACKHSNNYIVALNNLATLYERTGRIDKAVSLSSRVYKLAVKFNLPVQQSFALVSAGLNLACMGSFGKAIKLIRKACNIRSKLKLKVLRGHAYEHLGIVYLHARRFKLAKSSFQLAKTLYAEAGCEVDPSRVDIFLAIVDLEQDDIILAQQIIETLSLFKLNALEEGIFLYAKATLLFKTTRDKECLQAIHGAERSFRQIPSLFWLAKTHKLKSDYYRHVGNYEKSLLSLQAAYHLFSRLGARKELQNLPKEGLDMHIYQDFLEQLAQRLPFKALQMVKEILSEEDLDTMVTKILDTALELTSMDRALLILNEEPLRIFKSASLDDSNVKDIVDVSHSVLKSATDTGKSVLCYDASVDPMLQNRPSIIQNRILSVVCIPLRGATGKVIGSLYLDSCEGVETLAETEKVLLEIFSAIVGLALSQSLLLERSVSENKALRNWLELRKEAPDMIGNSPAIHQVLRTAQNVINHTIPILITGETGTGKELVARVLHYSGKRKNGQFVAVNCAAFSRELLESELFGHERGSFTGAMQLKKGVFEQAQNGTLFLDEIGEMPLEMQAKLLRVLQDGEYRRIGGTQTLTTNARVILATNRNIEEMVSKGTFREDLFYRIKVVDIPIPALRERSEDIPLLATAFLQQAMVGSGKRFLGFTHEALEVLKNYSWPGNVRQLKSEIERIVALNDQEWIDVENLDQKILLSVQPRKPVKTDLAGSLSEIEKRVILERLNEKGWNVVLAAKSLGITRHGLYSKMKRYNISNPNR